MRSRHKNCGLLFAICLLLAFSACAEGPGPKETAAKVLAALYVGPSQHYVAVYDEYRQAPDTTPAQMGEITETPKAEFFSPLRDQASIAFQDAFFYQDFPGDFVGPAYEKGLTITMEDLSLTESGAAPAQYRFSRTLGITGKAPLAAEGRVRMDGEGKVSRVTFTKQSGAALLEALEAVP